MADWSELKRLAEACAIERCADEGERDRLKAAGATLPAPKPKGRIESAMVQGLCIALALVEEELSVPKQDTGNARLRRRLQGMAKSETQGEEQLRADLSAERSRAAVLEQNCADLAAELERVRTDVESLKGSCKALGHENKHLTRKLKKAERALLWFPENIGFLKPKWLQTVLDGVGKGGGV